jgi:hypothetical protein
MSKQPKKEAYPRFPSCENPDSNPWEQWRQKYVAYLTARRDKLRKEQEPGGRGFFDSIAVKETRDLTERIQELGGE